MSELEKMLFEPYVSATTILRTYARNDRDVARETFERAKELYGDKTYDPYPRLVITDHVYQVLGLNREDCRSAYAQKKRLLSTASAN